MTGYGKQRRTDMAAGKEHVLGLNRGGSEQLQARVKNGGRLPLDQYQAYLFDLDGTVYSGESLIPGVKPALDKLRAAGKALLFVTNTTVRTREQVRERLLGLGVECAEDEVMTALCAAGAYFQEYEPDATVYMVGEEAMREELLRCGVHLTEEPLKASHVLVGLDRQFTYERLTAGMNALRNGALLIAANPDPFCPIDDGAIPDTWALVKALETASLRPTFRVIGKPSAYYAKKALELLKLPPEACLMVGDRLETDIRFGIANGMATALVLTGADSRKDMILAGVEPDYVLASLLEIVGERRPYLGRIGDLAP